MQNSIYTESGRLLEPIDRISEILFGLIMAVTIVGSLAIATAGRNEMRAIMAAALGCNLAWGLVDAVMYLLRTLTERTRNRALALRIKNVGHAEAHRLIAQALPEHVVAITGEDEIEGMRRRLLELPPPSGALLSRGDYLAALGIFLLVVAATFPVVIPFMLTDNAPLAMNVSRAVSVVTLFVAGFLLGRYAGHANPARTGL